MKQYDLAIVGAGIFGTFAAYHAVQRGWSVLLLEAGNEAKGASVRNFGQLVASGMALNGWRDIGERTLAHLSEIGQSANLPWKKNGSLYIASDEQELQLLEEMQHLNNAAGYQSRLLSVHECSELAQPLSKGYTKGGLFFPNDATAESPKLLVALRNFLIESGRCDFRPGHLVNDVEENDTGCTLRITDKSIYRANDVLICCGHQLNRLFPSQLQIPAMRICKLQMMDTPASSSVKLHCNLLTGLSIRRYDAFHSCPSHSALVATEYQQQLQAEGIHLLFTQRTDGSLIIGDSHHYTSALEVDSLDYHTDQRVNQLIIAEAQRILGVDELLIHRFWNGYYSQHDDGILAKRVQNRIHLVTGIGGKGMTCSGGITELVIQHLAEQQPLDFLNIQ
jgi:D-hydroxyproline dehydrogenase subunit beta